MSFLLVFLGAGAGGALRHGINLLSARLFGPELPVGTLVVNVAGSLFMGMLAGYLAQRGSGGEQLRLLLATGLLGGFTTFSAFSQEAALLYERGSHGALALYIAGSVLLALLAFFAGFGLIRYGNSL